MSDSTTQFITKDHIGPSFRRLLSQYRDKPRIVAFVRALARAGNVAEEELFSSIISFDLGNANGPRLDVWGGIVNELRNGLHDDDYRRFIKARMLANVSNGSVDELINIVKTAVLANDVIYVPKYPACYVIYVITEEPMSDIVGRRLARLMESARPAGVCGILIEASAPYFGFDGNPLARGYGVGRFARLLTT